MHWWDSALYDTCSLITLDKMLIDDPALDCFFPDIRTIEECLSRDNLRKESADRIRPRVGIQDLPPAEELLRLASALSRSLSLADKAMFSTAVHYRATVVTADMNLARALVRRRIRVGSIALILKELLHSRRITHSRCDKILADLERRNDLIIGLPQTSLRLQSYTFP